jgi:hypothetical protein
MLALPLAASGVLSGCGSGSGNRVSAWVESIERTCDYSEKEYVDYGAGEISYVSETKRKYDCSTDSKFLAIKRGETPNMRLYGHATVIVRYVDPKNHREQQAWIRIDALDPAFYSLVPGQDLRVRIDPRDSSKAYL